MSNLSSFYVWPLDEGKPLVLVQEEQFQTLLDEINSAFSHLYLKLDDDLHEAGFLIRFPGHPHLSPRYLGRSHSREAFDNLVSKAPIATYTAPGERRMRPARESELAAFRAQYEAGIEACKTKTRPKRLSRLRPDG